MSYSVSGVAAISFPVQTLQSDAYSVPGSHRAIAPYVADNKDISSTPNQPQAAPVSGVAKAPAPKLLTPVDTVTLTTSQRVLQLQREGESTLQIAATLNLPTKEVQSDLHVQTVTPQSFTLSPVTNPLSGNTTATVSVATGSR